MKLPRGLITCDPVKPSHAVSVAYDRALQAAVDDMDASLVYWLRAAWRRLPPHDLATDAVNSPAAAMQLELRKLSRRWRFAFGRMAPTLAKRMLRLMMSSSDTALRVGIQRAAGKSNVTFGVEFVMTKRMQQVYSAELPANVQLIRSIAAHHLDRVQQHVSDAVSVGGNLSALVEALQAQAGVTRRRAAAIALDQNSKAVASFTRTRQQEVGITRATWCHSHAGRVPRPEHVAADGKVYDVAQGMFLEGVWTWPGREINCRCFCRPVMPWSV